MKIGVISDTHGFFDPRLPELFFGVEHILHAGDIGSGSVIWELEKIAPVTAVLGNTDTDARFSLTEVMVLAGRKFLLQHIVDIRSPAEAVRLRIAREHPDVVVYGHTHKPHDETIGPTRFLNPGYAGRTRFGMARSVAVIECASGDLTARFLPL
jgi:uncharacterized protein